MLIDAHVHIGLNLRFAKKEWGAADENKQSQWIREIFQDYKLRNISAVRDGGDGYFVSKTAREIAASLGITYKSPIYALYKKGQYGSFLGNPVDGVNDFKEEFKKLLQYKPDHLKIVLTGIVNFKHYGDVGVTGFSELELKYMTEASKACNLPVMVHANGEHGVSLAIRAGVNSIEHGYLITEAELYGMAEKDIVWVPTLSPLGNILNNNDMNFVKEREVIQRVFDQQAKNIRRAMEIGVKVALGSDAGAYAVGHGSGLMDEIAHFERIGLARQEIEQMCIENGMKALFCS